MEGAVLKNRRRKSRRLLFDAIGARPRRKGAFLSIAGFQRETGLCRKTIIRELQAMEAEELIEVVRRDGSATPNQYRLVA